jgi:hypothetical protein
MQRNIEAINETLSGLPLNERCAALIVSLIQDDPRAVTAVASIVSVAAVMARHLRPEQRAAISFHLKRAADELAARWH